MRRYNITYTVEEDEFVKELRRLASSSEEYIENYSLDLMRADKIIGDQDFDLALREIVKLRQALAQADYRLHDVMGLISALTQPTTVLAEGPASDLPSPDVALDLSNRFEEVKKNIQKLGIEATEEEIMKLLKEAAPNG